MRIPADSCVHVWIGDWQDLFIRDVFYSEEAWKIRQEGPQYVNERGIQVAQPVSPDGKIRDVSKALCGWRHSLMSLYHSMSE